MKKIFFNKLFFTNLLQYLLLFTAAILIWLIFYPGLMSPDSLAQYEQALSGTYNDWHPPIMSLVLRIIIKAGGDIGIMTLIQCATGIIGVKFCSSLLLKYFSQDNLSETTRGYISTLLTLLFLLPFLSPFTLFSVIFWKDAWVAIILLWILSYLLWLLLNFQSLETKRFLVHICLFSFLSVVTVLIRHNSIVILPVLSIFCGVIAKIKVGRRGLLFIALPLLLAFLLNPIINFVFSVSHTYVGNTVLASDLVVMLRLYPELTNEFPLTARRKDSPVVLLTKDGGMWSETLGETPCPLMNKKICDPVMPLSCFGNSENTTNFEGNDCYTLVTNDNKVLKQEYYRALTHHPIALLNSKLFLFWRMLQADNWHDPKVICEIPVNSSGIKLNDHFSEARTKVCSLSHVTAMNWYLNWFSGIHLFWLILDIILILYFFIKLLIVRNLANLMNLLLFLIPLSYYLSYVVAATTPDYRFMYPSTLLMQVMSVSLLVIKFPGLFRSLFLNKDSSDLTIPAPKSSKEKVHIIIEGLKGKRVSEICATYEITEQQYYEWLDEFNKYSYLIFDREFQSRSDKVE